MNLSAPANPCHCAPAIKRPWLARFLRHTAQGVIALWNLRITRPRSEGQPLDLEAISPHLQRDLNLTRHAHAQREAAHYERVRQRLHWPHF